MKYFKAMKTNVEVNESLQVTAVTEKFRRGHDGMMRENVSLPYSWLF